MTQVWEVNDGSNIVYNDDYAVNTRRAAVDYAYGKSFFSLALSSRIPIDVDQTGQEEKGERHENME